MSKPYVVCVPTLEEMEIARKEVEERKNPNSTKYPTNEEVLICCKVFNYLISVGNCLGQEMLACWASSHYIAYESIRRARDI